MYFAKYLLSIEDLLEELDEKQFEKNRPEENRSKRKCDEALLERAFSRIDSIRGGKAREMRQDRARAACLGGGLLLQLAVYEALYEYGSNTAMNEKKFINRYYSINNRLIKNGTEGGQAEAGEKWGINGNGIKRYSVGKLLAYLEDKPSIPLAYRYGEKGKPYFTDLPFYFNLSHSGDYVLCGLSTVELGADIQQHRVGGRELLARRFFSKEEIAALAAFGEDKLLFFRLWARKEAYGKLTGEGVAGVLGMNLLPREGPADVIKENLSSGMGALPGTLHFQSEMSRRPDGRGLVWEEYVGLTGYSIAFCRYENAS